MDIQTLAMSEATFFTGVEFSAYFFLILSYIVKEMRLLRVLSTIGCGALLAYGIHYGIRPLMVVETSVITVNLYHLWKMRNDKR